MLSVNLDVTREFAFGDSTATFAFGAEYRSESYQTFAGDPLSYQAGPLAGQAAIGARAGTGRVPSDTRDLSRDVYSLYAELSVDLTENLLIDLAGRFESSDDYGDSLAGKFAARWEFADGLALRGSISNSFRAPSLPQRGFATTSTTFGTGGVLRTVNIISPDDPIARALGSPGLDAEESVNYSAGLTAANEWFSLSVDAFQIEVDGRINLSSTINTPNMPLAARTLATARNINRVQFFTNAVDTTTTGVEAVATAEVEFLGGELDLTAAYAYAETEIDEIRNFGAVLVLQQEDIAAIEGAIPKSRISLTGDWTLGDFGALLRLTRYGEATRVFNFGDEVSPFLVSQTYGEEVQVDLEVSYRFFEQAELFLGASNLFDAYPDRSSADISYFGNLPYDVLSPIGMNGRYVYAGFRADF